MDTNNDPFSRAMSQWDLETLYLDLASVKGKRLTPTEKNIYKDYSAVIVPQKLLKNSRRVVKALR